MSTIGSSTASADSSSSKRDSKRKARADFWRATRFLWPHRALVVVSTVCALFVGLAMAGGLTTMLPILGVLINGDTVPNWMDRTIIAHRLKVTLSAEGTDLRILRLDKTGPAASAGLHAGDSLALADLADPSEVLSTLSNPAISTATVHLSAIRTVQLPLPPLRGYWGLLRAGVARFPTGPVSSMAAVLGVGVCISLFGNSIRFFQEYYADKAAILAVNDARRRLYDHILHMPMDFFSLKGTSDVTSRLLQDCSGLQEGFKTVLGQSIQMPINAIWAFILAVVISWKLTLFIVLFAPLMLAVIRKFGKQMRRANRKALQSGSAVLGQVEASMQGLRVIKSNNTERFERRRFNFRMRGLIDENLRMSRIDAFSGPVVEILTLIVVCIIAIWATQLVQVKHELTPEQFFTVMGCLATIADCLRRVGKVNNVLQKSGAAAARIFEALEVPVERPRHLIGRGNRPKQKLEGVARTVRFQDINFSYANAASPALVGVNLTVNRGESVAIVGRNGSGKTTLAALLPRFFDPQQGRVLIDETDVRDFTLRSLRQQITVVTQDSVIFPGTIAENIAYGHPAAGRLHTKSPQAAELRRNIEAAARRAFAHDFILEKPQGYDTLMGEHGGSLSGGQRQRINIARAILRATPILILDEATSQVDLESENLIQKAIDGLIHERTTFVIAHRPATILSADRIIVMDRGTVVGQGSHDQLIRTCEPYASLYDRAA